jgi:CRP-like cAMP-binding protein
MVQEELELLKEIDIFKYLGTRDLHQFLSLLDLNVRTYSAGDVILEKDTTGEDFYVIQEGEVGIYFQDPAKKQEPNVRLGKGEFFGDLAAFYGFPRTAYVVAESQTEVLELDGNKIRALMDIHKSNIGYQVQKALDEKLAKRLRETNVKVEELERKLLQYE